MLTSFTLLVLATSSASLVWRMLKIDYPRFRAWVVGIPVIGAALGCGFCATMWFSLAAVLVMNPLAGYALPFSIAFGPLLPVMNIGVAWFAVGSAVLLLRSAIVVLMEAGAVLKHMHTANH